MMYSHCLGLLTERLRKPGEGQVTGEVEVSRVPRKRKDVIWSTVLTWWCFRWKFCLFYNSCCIESVHQSLYRWRNPSVFSSHSFLFPPVWESSDAANSMDIMISSLLMFGCDSTYVEYIHRASWWWRFYVEQNAYQGSFVGLQPLI